MNKTDAPARERAGGLLVLAVIAVLVVLVGGGWAAAYAAAGDKLANGTRIAGIDVGGQTSQQAERTLRRELAERLAQPVVVSAGGERANVTGGQAGLSVDYAASVREADTARSWHPGRLWDHYTGGTRHDAVVRVDRGRLESAVQRLQETLGTPATNGAVALGAEGVEVTQPQTGEGLDEDALAERLVDAVTAPAEARTVELSLTRVEPDIDQTDVQTAVTEFANPAMSAPVTLSFGSSQVRLEPQDFAPALELVAEDGSLQPKVDDKRLEALVDTVISHDAAAPVDATVRLVGGRPTVIPAKPGVTYQAADLSKAFIGVLTRPEGQRRVAVKATVADPEFTTEDAKRLGIKEKVSTFTTYYPYAEYRNVNIGRAAELVDGTVLKPGETFSLNGIVGERTRENGFTDGWTIQKGVFREDLGGGVSQLATTTFNAMFFAGLRDVEHKPHSLYISRYPLGREATVAWGSVDLRFENDTKYGVLVHAHVQPAGPGRQGVVTVSMWSTKVWDITTATSERYNFKPFGEQTITDGNCEPTVGARGFDVDVKRYFHKPGSKAVVRTENFHTTYIPQDHVTCQEPTKSKGTDEGGD